MNNRKFALSMVMKFAIFALIFGFFAMALFQYYGLRLFRRADSIGYAVTLILYAIVYVALGNLFRAFKITDYSIAEVASAVGYDNPLYFSRLFHKQVGMPPKEYRKKQNISDNNI